MTSMLHFHFAMEICPKSIHLNAMYLKKTSKNTSNCLNDSRRLELTIETLNPSKFKPITTYTSAWLSHVTLSYPLQADGLNHLWTILIRATRCAQRWKWSIRIKQYSPTPIAKKFSGPFGP